MARHRWATGERSSGPDRLERLFAPEGAGAASKAKRAWDGTAGGMDPADVESADMDQADMDQADEDRQGGGYEGGQEYGPAQNHLKHRASGRRWAATRRAALVAAGCTLAIGGWQFAGTGSGPSEVIPIAPPSPEAHAPAGAGSPGEAPVPVEEEQAAAEPAQDAGGSAGTVLVHVAGAVQTPGVVEAAAGSRVFEVLEKAGGPLPEAELSAINLAALVQDGQQILIPRVGEPLPQNLVPPATGTVEESNALINLNTAGAAELEELPRVGPVLAQRIVEWRTQHGPFDRPEDLDAVPGIGPAMLESLLPLVTV